jgi:hypothetical protein
MDKAEIKSILENIDIWLLVFGIIVVIGVGGESIFGFRHWWNSRKLQVIQDAEAGAQGEEIARLTEKSGGIEQENIKLRTTLAKLQRRTGQRYLSPDEQDELVKALSKYVITDVVIEFEQRNAEAERFGGDFTSVFKRLHWNPRYWAAGGINGTVGTDPITGRQILFFPPGITIRVADPSHPPPAAAALKAVLENLDFPFSSTIGKAPDWEPGQNNSATYLEVVLGDR